MPERSKGSDLRSFVLSTRGFKSHTLQIFFYLDNIVINISNVKTPIKIIYNIIFLKSEYKHYYIIKGTIFAL